MNLSISQIFADSNFFENRYPIRLLDRIQYLKEKILLYGELEGNVQHFNLVSCLSDYCGPRHPWDPIFQALNITKENSNINRKGQYYWKIPNFDKKLLTIEKFIHKKMYELAKAGTWSEITSRRVLEQINPKYINEKSVNNNDNPFGLSFYTKVFVVDNEEILKSLKIKKITPTKRKMNFYSKEMIREILKKKMPLDCNISLLSYQELVKKHFLPIKPFEVNQFGKAKALDEGYKNNWLSCFSILSFSIPRIRQLIGLNDDGEIIIEDTGSKSGMRIGLFPQDLSIMKLENEKLVSIGKCYIKNMETCKHPEEILRELMKSFGWTENYMGQSVKFREGRFVSRGFNCYFFPAGHKNSINKLIVGFWKNGIPYHLERTSDFIDQWISLADDSKAKRWRESNLTRVVTFDNLKERLSGEIKLGRSLTKGGEIIDHQIPWKKLKSREYLKSLSDEMNLIIKQNFRYKILKLRKIVLYYLSSISEELL